MVTSDDYIPCAAVAIHSLKDNNPLANVKVLFAGNVSPDAIRSLARHLDIDPIRIELVEHPKPWVRRGTSNFRDNFTKWRVWQLDRLCQRVIYIDSDFVVSGRLDHLFDLPSDALFASPNYDSDGDLFNHNYFNAGFMVLTPSNQTFVEMINFAQSFDASTRKGDQPSLNAFWWDCWDSLDPFLHSVNGNVWKIEDRWPLSLPLAVHLTKDLNPCKDSFPFLFKPFPFDPSLNISHHSHPLEIWFHYLRSLLDQHPSMRSFLLLFPNMLSIIHLNSL